MDEGSCSKTPPSSKMSSRFYPVKGESAAKARAICNMCPVKTECLDYAYINKEKFGVWGGKSESQRRRIFKIRRTADRAAKVALESTVEPGLPQEDCVVLDLQPDVDAPRADYQLQRPEAPDETADVVFIVRRPYNSTPEL